MILLFTEFSEFTENLNRKNSNGFILHEETFGNLIMMLEVNLEALTKFKQNI